MDQKKILTTCLRSGDGKIPSCPPYAITVEGTGDASSEIVPVL